jgi:hypothetical protein
VERGGGECLQGGMLMGLTGKQHLCKHRLPRYNHRPCILMLLCSIPCFDPYAGL